MLHPEHDFSGGAAAWQRRVFLRASVYRVVITPNREHASRRDGNMIMCEYKDFRRAVRRARQSDRALIFAETPLGRGDSLSRSRWAEYLEAWPKALNAGGPGHD